MKVKVISRNPDEYLRETKLDIHKVPRNYDPSLHPFETAREYVRALNAVKLERVFSKPFIGNLSGHRDAVSCLAKHPQSLSELTSGSYDGEIRVWDLPRRVCTRWIEAHDGIIRGITYTPNGQRFISVSDDKTIKTWNSTSPQFGEQDEPVETVLSRTVLTGISHHRRDPKFATCGELCQIWESSRNEPVQTLKWSPDSLHCVEFNPIESSLLASCSGDRSIILYDTRENLPLRKVVMKMRSNRVKWNPMEAFVFTVASEDYNLYTFDTRKLHRPLNIHQDHTSAVIDLDYSPTGTHFVSGSYDKTCRIFETGKGHSCDVYHTKRMQRLTCVVWSSDNKYVLTGSDEMNIRMWKAKAWEKLGVLKPRERNALEYSEALKEKFSSHPQIRRISRHRQVPKHVYNARLEHRVLREKSKRKETNRVVHSKPGAYVRIPERERHVLREEE